MTSFSSCFRALARLLAYGALFASSSCGSADTCPTSIAAYCEDGGCPLTWAAAQDPKSWAGMCQGSTVLLNRCTGINTAVLSGGETAINYQYDAATGALVRIESIEATSNECIAGSALSGTCDGLMPEALISCPP